MPRAAALRAPAAAPANSARAASASASAAAPGATAAAPGSAVTGSGGRARGAAAARRAKRVVRRLAQGTVLAAGLVALQVGSLDSEPRERLFDVHMVDRLESPLTRYRD